MPAVPQRIVPAVAPPVLALGIFVARRQMFDAVVDVRFADQARDLVFGELPLRAHGWTPEKTRVSRVKDAPGMIWRFERME